MKVIRRFLSFFKADPDYKKYRWLFYQELNRLCGNIVIIGGLIAMVGWLSYIPLDKALHPEIPLIYFRVGLTVIGLIVFLLGLTPLRKKHGMAIFLILTLYLEFSTVFLTAWTKSDPAYTAGMCLVIVLTIIPALPFFMLLTMNLISATIYGISTYHFGFQSTGSEREFILNTITIAYFVSCIFAYIFNKMRFRNFHSNLLLLENLAAQAEMTLELQEARKTADSERNKSDQLLNNILPEKVAAELKLNGEVVPLFYDSVTILFTDFEGFTRIASGMLPDELIEELNQVFTQFDAICKKYNLEKIKTIGDAYMAAAGLPETNLTHAVDACLAAMEIAAFIEDVSVMRKLTANEAFWRIRIGIHTGPVMAGIIGQTKFAYDIFGDAVNVASRTESSSEPGRINISEDTFNIVKEFFICEDRGEIDIKNHGKIRMYFLNRIRPELSHGEDGRLANAEFRKRVATFRGEYS